MLVYACICLHLILHQDCYVSLLAECQYSHPGCQPRDRHLGVLRTLFAPFPLFTAALQLQQPGMSVYTPRKCDATNRIIGAKDHASVQFNIADIDGQGVYTKTYSTVVLSGFVRHSGNSDAQVNKYVHAMFPRWRSLCVRVLFCVTLLPHRFARTQPPLPTVSASPSVSPPVFPSSRIAAERKIIQDLTKFASSEKFLAPPPKKQ